MKENSIEEDIKIVENYLANSAINEIDSNFFKNSGWETVDLEIPKSMQHILPDYKRVLKENEELNGKILSNAGIYQLGFKDGEESYIKKVKDKIKEYKNMLKTCNKVKDIDRIKAINERILELEELLEGRE